MYCLDTVESARDCLHTAIPVVELIAGLVGLGTFAFIAILHWTIKTLKKQLQSWEDRVKAAEKETGHAKEAMRFAEEAKSGFEILARDRAAQVKGLKTYLQKLEENTRLSGDESKKEVTEISHRAAVLQGKLNAALKATEYDEIVTLDQISSFWCRAAHIKQDYTQGLANSIPILFFGNQKGGVGKTMTSTNLAACFATHGERVLLVDLDYQGSSSAMFQDEEARERARSVSARRSRVNYLFELPLRENWKELAIKSVRKNLDFVESFYFFETVERGLEFRWCLGECQDDVRYRLANVLLSATIQRSYDRIILDAPPRFTLGFINGFCAATHLFVPTLVDRVSVDAVEFFARQFARLRPALNPALRLNGVIGTVSRGNEQNTLPGVLTQTADDIDKKLDTILGDGKKWFMRNAVLTRKAAIAQMAEAGIPYLQIRDQCQMYDQLADVISALARSRKYASRAA